MIARGRCPRGEKVLGEFPTLELTTLLLATYCVILNNYYLRSFFVFPSMCCVCFVLCYSIVFMYFCEFLYFAYVVKLTMGSLCSSRVFLSKIWFDVIDRMEITKYI